MNELRDYLWIGDIQDAQTRPLRELGIDHVITVCQDSVEDNVSDQLEYDHFCMSDGDVEGHVPGDPSFELFEEAVDGLRVSISAERTVFVHCHMGRSRSAAVCASAVAIREGRLFDDVLHELSKIRYNQPERHLVTHGRQYVAKHGDT